jgi:hypothetical protein
MVRLRIVLARALSSSQAGQDAKQDLYSRTDLIEMGPKIRKWHQNSLNEDGNGGVFKCSHKFLEFDIGKIAYLSR